MIVYAVAFLSGAVVLVLEILGTRLLAPVYGTTVIVWACVITVTLAALAAGYAAGGAMADRALPLDALGACLGLAGLWLLALPWLRKPVLIASMHLGVRAGAFLSALVLLGLPLMGLGGVGPLCVRLRAHDPSRIGREVGGVYAVSTAGSVLGALAAGFYLIGQFKVTAILAGLSALLLALAAACLWANRRRLGLVACAGALWALGSALVPPARAAGVVFHESSFYGDLRVADRPGGIRVLYIDGIPNTVLDLRTFESTSDYIKFFELLSFLRPEGRKALLIGLGGGSLPMAWARHYGVSTDIAEIDSKILRVARDYFGFKPSGQVFLEDGRVFLARRDPSYDFIVLDAFNGDQHPYQLFTREAFEAARRRLKPDGVLAMNLIGYGAGPRAELLRSEVRTLKAVFPYVRVFNASSGLDWRTSFLNLILLASEAPLEFRRDPWSGRPEIVRYYSHVVFQWLGPERDALLRELGEGALITDDLNSIERLSSPAFVAIRKVLAKQFPENFDD